MSISASLVKELRERTGAGMMECKKALVETHGDIEAAIELMRKSGQAKAAKKAGRIASEGVIRFKQTVDGHRMALVEVNSETDFVAKDTSFLAFADAVAECALNAPDLNTLLASPLRDGATVTVNQAREELIAQLGENMNVRRCECLIAEGGRLYSYSHGTRIGVIVEIAGGDAALGKDIAMHIAANNPLCVKPEEVSAELIAKERTIYLAQAAESGKTEAIVEKMVEGRVRKFLAEVTLHGQPFVKDPDVTVEKLLKSRGAQVLRFCRLEVGEGIEKKQGNFAEEVAAQAQAQSN